ncbi:MAG: FtsQ-type POTRA domain-containing protein [Candidatus Synoicihabitans palmerolidicus]|nr:FtsQ-type POTRA domain-containing protein [Candidatus Synoicihabitans palmerolidicus]
MSDSPSSNPSARSWRDIPQEITSRAMSRVGRRRLTVRTMRTIAMVVGGLILAGGGFEIWRTLQDNPQKWTATVSSKPVRHIIVETDGVLNQVWVEETLQLRRDIGLRELELYAQRARLLTHQQIKSAVLKLEFPDTLRVTLAERSPVVRLKAQLDGPDLHVFLVAKDGTVFSGHGYGKRAAAKLPWLAGVRLVRAKVGFSALKGMDQVADLLSTARGNAPELFATWQVVSLERLARDGHILVKSSEVAEIIFGLREDFYSQVARLDLIIDETRRREVAPMRSIDLSVGAAQVPVAFNISSSLPPPAILVFPPCNFPSTARHFHRKF